MTRSRHVFGRIFVFLFLFFFQIKTFKEISQLEIVSFFTKFMWQLLNIWFARSGKIQMDEKAVPIPKKMTTNLQLWP